ncbi:SusC/RagA family TonB-linked outer membrane protein [Psychroflexus halocasei]|uniref:TonB-linked outer membrane protein, SusC/RagA family n=1 Tax=Psychroflexus halocasei TaxID=908615 RepID=A0A1H3VI42_9FLAO|nr:SusC/RagA family TonB-linked outer membrane protein [Psychroflexus halocasei]SDZ74341.1 TonB-linked outer membrane protein, SusC/RagA family [Psychroflexus halocasei]
MRTKFSGFLTLLLVLAVQISFAQTKTVTGTVTGEDGLPIPGVNVIEKGTSNGTQTDFDGNYSISVASGQTIVFSYLGMKKQEVVVNNQSTINITLLEDAAELAEVVVTGYSSIDRSEYGGSISSVQSEDLEQIPLASFEQILQGKAAGLQITAGSGQPGSSARVRIRGNGSINGENGPMYIVDGIEITPGDFANLNSNDFERVDVLKDANATALYGSRGANGVIVVSTKKGSFSKGTTFNYKTSFGFSEIGEAKFEMMNSSQLLNFQRLIGRGLGAGKTDAEIAELAMVNTDWSDEFFRTGTVSTHELSMDGGNDKTRFFSSVQYLDQEGLSLRSGLKRFSLRNNLEHRPDEKTQIGLNTQMSYSKSSRIDSESSVTLQNPFAAAYLGSPYHAPYDENGDFNTGGGRVGPNALEHLLKSGNDRNVVKIIASGFANRELFENVTAGINLGVDYQQSNVIRYTDPNSHYGRTTDPGQQGSYNESNRYDANITSTTNIGYANTFDEKHNFSFDAYLEYYKRHVRSSGFTGYGINELIVGYPGGITAGSPSNELIPTISGGVLEEGIFSYFGIADYGYDGRFGINASVRRDSSSLFADENKWATFWSVAGRWNLHEEGFMDGADFVDNLKLRASYGTSGNKGAIDPFQYATSYGQSSYDGQPGFVPTNLGNSDLTWETSNQLNIGLDFDLFDYRLYGSVEYYNNLTTELFIDYSLSATAGATSIESNNGEMSNKGVDLSLNYDIVRSEDKDGLNISLNVNANYNKNTIEDLGQVNEFEQGTSIIREGLPLGTHYIVGWAGVNPANGQPLYLDKDGNVTNQYSEDNSTANYGSFNPEYTGGFGGTISYKGFKLSTLFTFQAEYYRFNNQTFFQENPNFSQYNLSTKMLDMWKQPGDVTEVQSYLYGREFSSKDIEDASFLKWRNLTLGYTFSDKVIESIGYISGLRVYGMAQNLSTWTKFTGFDPEDDNNIAQYEYPTPTTITFGVDLKF